MHTATEKLDFFLWLPHWLSLAAPLLYIDKTSLTIGSSVVKQPPGGEESARLSQCGRQWKESSSLSSQYGLPTGIRDQREERTHTGTEDIGMYICGDWGKKCCD
ncbi:hypothetical protein KIL84_013558 [Mauremys mutica]|uniref:Uncharacterized protein n=1 Tax=Mauremys mutica TaxID=74926 RepID=A0A9D3WX44_9SAUR|nr:hypothetical protein KIL84_013558 [Mauremys mutica]